MTLEPGDIVSMGTALKQSSQGGAVQNIDLNRLGGPISVTIDKIGTLTNSSYTPRDLNRQIMRTTEKPPGSAGNRRAQCGIRVPDRP